MGMPGPVQIAHIKWLHMSHIKSSKTQNIFNIEKSFYIAHMRHNIEKKFLITT